jgi:peptidase M50B-like protein
LAGAHSTRTKPISLSTRSASSQQPAGSNALLRRTGTRGLIGIAAVTGASHDASAGDTMSGIAEIQTPLPAAPAVLTGLVAAILVTGPEIWNTVQHAETVVHEGAHVLVGINTGFRIKKVIIGKDGGGETEMERKSGDASGAAASFAGYVGASVAGLISAALIFIGRMALALFLGLLLYVVVLWFVRNLFGVRVILVCGLLLYLVLRYATAGVETAVAYGVTWFLLISGTRIAFRAARRPKEVKDAENLAKITQIFRWVWCLLWLILTIAALVVGGALLTRI